MSEEKVGIKETKEALKAALVLGTLMAKKFADGVQLADALELYSKMQSDPEFSALMLEAYNGMKNVPAELKDIDLAEGIELAMIAAAEVPNLIEALKK